MEGAARPREEGRKSLKERLGLSGMGCCAARWGFGPSSVSVPDEEEEIQERQEREIVNLSLAPATAAAVHGCEGQSQEAVGMNLATALAAERLYRAAQDSDGGVSPAGPEMSRPNSVPQGSAPGTPSRMSLMRLLHESDGEDVEREAGEKAGQGQGSDSMCCVCMGRKKGAAFIPCGHTFCRVCSRELWLNRGSCPLCNRPILEILDIF